MRFVLREDRCCPNKLGPGEAKRVPKSSLRPIVGFYVGCPFCGAPATITSRSIDPNGQDFNEADDLVTMGPGHTCARCRRCFRVDRGEIVHVA